VLVAAVVAALTFINLPQITEQLAISDFTPSPGIASLAASLDLTAEGREIMALNPPQLLPEGDYDVVCPSPVAGIGTVSCIADGQIILYDVTNTRFKDVESVGLAYQLLYAAWERLTPEAQSGLVSILTAAAARGDAKDARESIAFAVKNGRESQFAATYAVLGTESANVGRELEESYGRLFTDRAAIVAMNAESREVLALIAGEIQLAKEQMDDAEVSLMAENDAINTGYDQLYSDSDLHFALNDAFGYSSQEEFDAAYNPLVARGEALDARSFALLQRGQEIEAMSADRDVLIADLDALYASINIESWSYPGDV